MTGPELLRHVEMMQRERNISRETVFSGIEAALQLAAQKYFGADKSTAAEEISISIDRSTGNITALHGGKPIDPSLLGRIAAQSAKQLLIQKFREAECQAVFDEYAAKKGDLVKGTIQRFEHGTATVSLGKSEAILPRSEQITGETYHVGEQVKAVITDVKKNGHRVRIVLSRTHPDFVRQLFIREIPEIADRTIEIKAVAREAGYRTKVAVSSIDMKVDCVGACVGVRGSRIKNVIDELGGERIDIVRWNDALQVLIPNALQPAQIEEVFLYPRLGRAIVLVQEDQLSLAIGRRGQNVRLASKLVGWDIEIMTHDELNQGIERAEGWFSQLPHITAEVLEAFIEEGFLSYVDLTFFDSPELAEITGLTEEQAQDIIDYAEEAAEAMGDEASRGREQEGRGAARSSAAASKASALFKDNVPTTSGVEAKPTFESLWRDEPATPPEMVVPETPPEATPTQEDTTPIENLEGVMAEEPPHEEENLPEDETLSGQEGHGQATVTETSAPGAPSEPLHADKRPEEEESTTENP